MRRIVTWLFFVPALVAVVVFALNNKSSITLDLWPFGFLIELPTYLAMFLGVGLGALIGGSAAWLGQSRVRSKLRDEAYEGEVARRALKAEQERTADLEAELARKSAQAEVANVPALKAEPLQETLPPPAA